MATIGVLQSFDVRFEESYEKKWEDGWEDSFILMTGHLPVVFSNRS